MIKYQKDNDYFLGDRYIESQGYLAVYKYMPSINDWDKLFQFRCFLNFVDSVRATKKFKDYFSFWWWHKLGMGE